MTHFMNAKDDMVTEAINGLLAASGGKLCRLDGYPHIRVVARSDWDKSKVALISGGGSGHEPAHAGFVGQGMLTAAICGDIFASPSVDAVLAGLLAVTGPAGCLLIVKNYTGDRLNFGLAAERARALGLNVNVVVVDDDIALPDLPQARGVAGTIFVHKIAGALAEEGADLKAVTDAAHRVIDATRSIGMSLETCVVPGSPKEDRIPEGMAELGLGIHGEPGVEQIEYTHARQAIDAVAGKLEPTLSDGRYVALLNNLGGTSELEMSVLAAELVKSRIGDRLGYLVGPAAMMTSLTMQGFSVSVMKAGPREIALLEAPCPIAAWPGCVTIAPDIVIPLPDGLSPAKAPPSADEATRTLLIGCCNALIAAESDLNRLDAKSGDGDTGSTLAGAARALLLTLDSLPLSDQAQLFRAIGQDLSQTMGGSSGVLLAIFFSAAAEASSSGMPIQQALEAGLSRMQQIGGATVGDRTMIDALHPALAAMKDGPVSAANAARKGANHTATLTQAKAGRAAYVSAQQLAGHIDPGAEAVARLFEHLASQQR